MKLTLKPQEIPFTVGATVWVNQACKETDQYAYYQAIIIQVILNGSLTNSIVIRHPGNLHELTISDGIYDLKPVGVFSQCERQTATVDFLVPQTVLFQTQEELLAHQCAQ